MGKARRGQACLVCHFWADDENHVCPDTPLVRQYYARLADRDATHRLNVEYANHCGDPEAGPILARIDRELMELVARGKAPRQMEMFG